MCVRERKREGERERGENRLTGESIFTSHRNKVNSSITDVVNSLTAYGFVFRVTSSIDISARKHEYGVILYMVCIT